MAHKKAGGSSRNGRDSNAKRLGVKAFGGELIEEGAQYQMALFSDAPRRFGVQPLAHVPEFE